MEVRVIFFFQNIQVAALCWKVLVDSALELPKAYPRTLYGERYSTMVTSINYCDMLRNKLRPVIRTN
jgi:hypothetical protein